MNKLIFTLFSLLLSFQLIADSYNPWSFQLHYEYNARPATPWNPEVEKPVRELTTYIRQRLPLSPQLVNSIEEWRSERVDHENRLNEIQQQKFELMQEMSSFLSGGAFNNLPPHLRATPIPTTMTSEQALKPLKPLFDSLENSDVVKSVEEVNKLIKEIALKKALGLDSALTNFLESEIKREMVNNAGIVRHLPFAPVPEQPFRSSLWTPRGSALVQKTNDLLASQSTLSQELKSQCSKGHCLDERKALVDDRRLYERTKTLVETLALSDSLRSLGRNSSRVEQLVQQEIDLLNELSKNLPPEQALTEYFQYVAKGQREIIQELERIGYENLINFTRPVEFDESHLGDHLLNSEDQLLLKNARLSECINSHELCRSRTELASEVVAPILGSDGVELEASIAHRGLRETLNVRNKLQSSSITHVEARNISQKVLTSASQSFATLDNETGTSLLEAGQMIADIALGITPGVSVAKDIYELVSGKNLVTGETLSQTDLVIAGVGVLTLGLANPIKNGVKFLKGLELGAETATVISKTLNSARKLGFDKSSQIGEFINSSAGKTWAKIKTTGQASVNKGYKIFNKDVPISNDMPLNGVYARIVDKKYADKIRSGELGLSRNNPGNEAFVTAFDDVANILNPSDYAKKLSLFSDKAGNNLLDTSDYVVLKFKFKLEIERSLRTPFETANNARNYGFVPGGTTAGGAREWLVDNDAVKRGIIEFID